MNIRNFFRNLITYGSKSNAFYAFCLVILFWTIFEGIISYIAPLVITENGLSKTLMGLVLSTSSIAGALFDLLLCRIVKNTSFRRIYLFMFALCFVFLLIFSQANTAIIFFIAMAMWGIFYDLQSYGNFDFIARCVREEEHASGFGILMIFKELGYLLAPIIMGLIIVETVEFDAYLVALLFLVISVIFFTALLFLTRKKSGVCLFEVKRREPTFIGEIHVMRKVLKILLPVLLLSLMMYFIDSYFWTLGPLIAESLTGLGKLNSLFMVAYLLPTLISGWFVGAVTKKLGKKKTAYWGLLIGSVLMIFIFLIKNPILIILIVFGYSCFISFSHPSINGAYADYIAESPQVEKEIQSLEDFSNNIGFMLGPTIAGLLSDLVGMYESFSILGISGAVLAIILLKITPKKIHVPVPNELKQN